MHPSFAQALENGSQLDFFFFRGLPGLGARRAVRARPMRRSFTAWEAQLSRPNRESASAMMSNSNPKSNSWGARMRRANVSEHENLYYFTNLCRAPGCNSKLLRQPALIDRVLERDPDLLLKF